MTYPPDHAECRRLFAELKHLDTSSGHEFNDRKYEIIHDLAEAHFYEAKPYFVAGLESPDPDYRWTCISALSTHWQDDDAEIVSMIYTMARIDPDVSVRDIAISSLGILKVREALPFLKQVFEIEQDQGLRKSAYLSILKIVERPPEEIERLWRTDLESIPIDEDLLRTIP
jgi:HEAT repeat protein